MVIILLLLYIYHTVIINILLLLLFSRIQSIYLPVYSLLNCSLYFSLSSSLFFSKASALAFVALSLLFLLAEYIFNMINTNINKTTTPPMTYKHIFNNLSLFSSFFLVFVQHIWFGFSSQYLSRESLFLNPIYNNKIILKKQFNHEI